MAWPQAEREEQEGREEEEEPLPSALAEVPPWGQEERGEEAVRLPWVPEAEEPPWVQEEQAASARAEEVLRPSEPEEAPWVQEAAAARVVLPPSVARAEPEPWEALAARQAWEGQGEQPPWERVPQEHRHRTGRRTCHRQLQSTRKCYVRRNRLHGAHRAGLISSTL